MDPLFERRELVRILHLEARFLQRNLVSNLLAQLRHKYEGVCTSEGYIQRNSIALLDHSLGRTNLIRGGIDYEVRFQADVCMPHPGQVFRAAVNLKSKIGLHVELPPLKVLLPRDLHIDTFDEIAEGQEVEFEVVGSRFQQGDETIIVLGKMRSLVRPAEETAPAATLESVEVPMILAAPVGSSESEEKRVVTVTVESAKAPEQTKRKRLRAEVPKQTNE